MKTFDDLIFNDREDCKPLFALPELYGTVTKHAIMEFPNGYGVSVLLGKMFYSNGVDTYEVAILFRGDLCYTTHLTNDVLGNQTAEDVTEIMKQVQELKHQQLLLMR